MDIPSVKTGQQLYTATLKPYVTSHKSYIMSRTSRVIAQSWETNNPVGRLHAQTRTATRMHTPRTATRMQAHGR